MTTASSQSPIQTNPAEPDLWVEAPIPMGEASWLVCRYRDAKTILHDSRFSSRLGEIQPAARYGGAKGLGGIKDRLMGLFKPQIADSTELVGQLRGRWIPLSDPPDHTRLRASVKAPFTKRYSNLRPKIRARAEQLIARGRAAGIMDVDADLAFPLTTEIMVEL